MATILTKKPTDAGSGVLVTERGKQLRVSDQNDGLAREVAEGV